PLAAFGALAGALTLPAPAGEEPGKMWVFLGTYTGGKSKGIYRCEFDPATGKLGEPALAAEAKNPTFLAIPSSGKYLYACAEHNDLLDKKSGAMLAFALDAKTGELKPLNSQPSKGAGPCHVSIDKTGKCMMAANYGGGSVIAYPIEADGKLGASPEKGFVQHAKYTGTKKDRTGPHAHSINPDPSNKFAVACD